MIFSNYPVILLFDLSLRLRRVSLINKLNQQISRLREQATALDKQLLDQRQETSEQWFDPHIFRTRAQFASPYVEELEQTKQQWMQDPSPQRTALLEHRLTQQLEALSRTLAWRLAPKPRKPTQQSMTREQTLQRLRDTLQQYHQYERRLNNMLATATTISAKQQTEQRLNRCQQAINDIQAKLQRYAEK